MHKLYDKASGAEIGDISDGQFDFLQSQLEEESLEDRDYSITAMELDYFESQNADPGLVSLLRAALGQRDELVILWK